MKKITNIILLSAVLFVAACSESKQGPEVAEAPEAGMVFTGSLSSMSRSTFLDGTLTTLKWESSDDIGVYALRMGTVDPSQVSAEGTVSGNAVVPDIDLPNVQSSAAAINLDFTNPTFAWFTAPKSASQFMPDRGQSGVEDVYSYFAYYPLKGAPVGTFVTDVPDPGARVFVPANQTSERFGDYQICAAGGRFETFYSRSALLSGDAQVNFEFEPVTALIRFRMKLGSGNANSYGIEKVKLTLADGNLSGDVILSPHAGEGWWAIPVSTDDASHSVTIDYIYGETTVSSYITSGYWYAVVLPTFDKTVQDELTFIAYDKNGIPILFAKKQLPVHTAGSETTYGFRQGKVYTLDLEFNEFTAEAVAGKYNPFDWE